MRKRLRRKLKMRKLLKLAITIFIIVIGCQIYHDLGVLGAIEDKTTLDKIMLPLGWIWLLFGEFMTLCFIWEE